MERGSVARRIKIGCCGFPVARSTYFKKFNVVEIQHTFYHIPPLELAPKWKSEAPPEFEFTMKAWQLITHESTSPTYKKLKRPINENRKEYYGFFKPTDAVFEAWEETQAFGLNLGARIILFQTPPGFSPSRENMVNIFKFFKTVKRDGMIFMWEPRGGWEDKDIEKICKELDLIDVVDPFKRLPVWGQFNYFRLHGVTGYRYQYSERDLKKLLDLCQKKTESYIFFNNMTMLEDSQKFISLLR
ncbi:MAG: DUF72 domain-containing protein [Acidobacteriota bacterium]